MSENKILKNWVEKSLDSLTISSKNGKTGRPKDGPPGIPRLGITTVTQQGSGYVNENECKFVEVSNSEIEQYSVINGDILFCRQNGNKEFVGKCAVYRGNTKPIIFSDSLIRFRINTNEILPEFLVIFTNSSKGRMEIEQFCLTTAGNYSINSPNLKQIKIPLPPIETQKKIIQKLDHIFAQLEEKKKVFLILQENKKKNLTILSDRAIGNIISKLMCLYSPPDSWIIQNLEDVCQDIQPGFAEGKKDVTGGIIHLRMNNIGINFELNFNLIRTIEANNDQLVKYTLKQGDIIFNNTNSSKLVGKSAIFSDSRMCLYSNHLTRLRVNRNLVLPEWLLFYLRARWLNGDFERMCNKWINQAAVNNNKIRNLEIPVPKLEIQEKIIESISNISMNIAKIKTLSQNILIQAENNTKHFKNLQMNMLDSVFSGKLIN